MIKFFCKIGLFLGVLPVYSAEYFLNDQPVSRMLNSSGQQLQVITSSSGNEDDVAIIQMTNNHINIRWGKTPADYNSVGYKKEESGSGRVKGSHLSFSSIEDKLGLIGLSDSNLTLQINTAKFTQTSLTFKDSFKILPLSPCNVAFQGIELIKKEGVIYPLLDGEWNYNTSAEVIKKLNVEQGFMVMGCNVNFIFDVTNISK